MATYTVSARIILDNGGGIVLQFGGWACSPAGSTNAEVAAQAAQLIRDWLVTGSTDGWEGHDADALAAAPTHEEIRNGGYKVITIDRDTDTAVSLSEEVRWGAAGEALGDALASTDQPERAAAPNTTAPPALGRWRQTPSK